MILSTTTFEWTVYKRGIQWSVGRTRIPEIYREVAIRTTVKIVVLVVIFRVLRLLYRDLCHTFPVRILYSRLCSFVSWRSESESTLAHVTSWVFRVARQVQPLTDTFVVFITKPLCLCKITLPFKCLWIRCLLSLTDPDRVTEYGL